MLPNSAATQPLRSTLLDTEPDLRDVVEEFVAGLPAQVSALQDAAGRLAWDEITLLSHRLKGSGGSYGYPDLSKAAALAEQAALQQDRESALTAVAHLERLVNAVRAGLAA